MTTLQHLDKFIALCGSSKIAAERLHITPQQITDYTKGRRNPGAKLREKLLAAGYSFEDENIVVGFRKEIGERWVIFSKLLPELMNKPSLSSQEFADILGVSVASIEGYGRGVAISDIVLNRLFTLRCDLNWLITGYWLPVYGMDKDEQLELLHKVGISSAPSYIPTPSEQVKSYFAEYEQKKSRESYQEGYNAGLKDNEKIVSDLRAQVDILMRLVGNNRAEPQHQILPLLSPEVIQTKSNEKPIDKPIYKYTEGFEDEVEPSLVRVNPRKPKYKPIIKAAATPLLERNDDYDRHTENDRP